MAETPSVTPDRDTRHVLGVIAVSAIGELQVTRVRLILSRKWRNWQTRQT